MNISKKTEDELNNILESDTKDKKADLEILKELFEGKNIETKTEFSPKQVILFNQKRMIAKLLNWKSLKNALDDFMLLNVSKERKGRAEFVDGFKSEREGNIRASQGGFFSNLRDKLGFQR